MDWQEGVTMDEWLKINANNTSKLEEFYKEFHKLCVNLLCAHVAHGDLKPDNILVEDKGYYTLKLIDLDGMFVPEMYGSEAREYGTQGYSHPRRQELPFDEHIDDYACVIMLLALKFTITTGNDYSLILEKGVENVLKEHPELMSDKEFSNLYIAYQYVLLHGRIDKPLIPYLLNNITYEQHCKELNLKHQAKEGNTTAMIKLSSFYMSIGDYSNAYKWADFAYRLGNVNAECHLCKLYRFFDSDLILHGGRKYCNNAISLLAQHKEPFSLCCKGEEIVATGSIEEKSNIFEYAAKMGSISAEGWLGTIWADKDKMKSLRYYESAAAKGSLSSQRKLGFYYLKEEKDYKRSFDYFLLSAKQGDGESMYIIGLMYEGGLGTLLNKAVAYTWFAKSADEGYPKAKEKLDDYKFKTDISIDELPF